jgi:probable F420-dependent oxidoreductase
LTAMASVTDRANIGGLVFCNSYRNPQLLADAHRTIDHLSGGRVILGIGAGWFERDYDEYGYGFGTAPDRLRALRRDLPLMKERLGKVNPPPTREIPFLIGGSGEKVTLKLVARYAQLWHGFADLETYRQKAAILAEHCASVGRDPASIEHVIGTRGNILEEAEGLADAGVAELTIGVGGENGAYDLGPLRELLAWRDRYNAAH